jgi:hypothetical protein
MGRKAGRDAAKALNLIAENPLGIATAHRLHTHAKILAGGLIA